MVTTVTKTIGSGRDYSNLTAWMAACPANLVTSDQIWEGILYQEGPGTNGEWTESSTINIGGTTTDSTRFVRLTAAPGQSWRNNAANAAGYYPANGVAVRGTGGYSNGNPFTITANYTQLIGLQAKSRANNPVFRLWFNSIVDSCMLTMELGTGNTAGVINDQSQSGIYAVNSTFIGPTAMNCGSGPLTVTHYNCTYLGEGTQIALSSNYGGTGTFINGAFFGFTGIGAGYATSTSGYNGTDLATLGGTSTVTSLSGSACFVNYSTGGATDLQLKTGSGLIGIGTSSGAPTVDAYGTSRPQNGTWDAGMYELVGSLPPTPFSPRAPYMTGSSSVKGISTLKA